MFCYCSEYFKDDAVFYVPEVIWDLTTKQVLTTELVSGEPLDKLVNSDQKTRNWVGACAMKPLYEKTKCARYVYSGSSAVNTEHGFKDVHSILKMCFNIKDLRNVAYMGGLDGKLF